MDTSLAGKAQGSGAAVAGEGLLAWLAGKGSSQMAEPVQHPLNPVDHGLLAIHESLRQRGYCGLPGTLVVDVEGPLEPGEVAEAVRRLGQAYPALSSHVRFSRVLRRAGWVIDGDVGSEAAIDYRYREVDPQASDVDAPLRDAFREPIDPTRGPQVRLIHVRTGAQRHRLALIWGHYLMDLEGGHMLIGELDALLRGQRPAFRRDPPATPLRPYRRWFPKSLCRLWQGRLRHLRLCLVHQPRIVEKPKQRPNTANFELRRYDAAFRQRFEAVARARTSPGPMRYSRGCLIAAARTYLEMCLERGRPRERYVFMQVMRLPRLQPRPQLHGNYVSIPWVSFRRADLESWTRADATAFRQLRDYARKGRDEANWEMLLATARWPFPLARYFATHRMPRSAAGFSSFRFGNNVTGLGRARITNLVQVVTMNCHPGWILSESTYGDGMSVSIGYFENFIDPASVREFLDRLEAKLQGVDRRFTTEAAPIRTEETLSISRAAMTH